MRKLNTTPFVGGLVVIAVPLLSWIVLAGPTFTDEKMTMTSLANSATLRSHVAALCAITPPRSFPNQKGLAKAAAYIRAAWEAQNHSVTSQPFEVEGVKTENLWITFGPAKAERFVIGAHYDVFGDHNPGADDNASGVAGLLELSRLLAEGPLEKRIDLVAYTLEEPPQFGTDDMGSAVHAKWLKDEKVPVLGMLSLEMIGYFDDDIGSQGYPLSLLKAFYPRRGNFISVIGDLANWGFVRRVKRHFRAGSEMPVRSLNGPSAIAGVDFSDHRNYSKHGFPAAMITDTAFYRNTQYHQPGDTPDRLDYERMAQTVDGVHAVARAFTRR